MRLISALFTFWLSEAVHGKGAERFRLFKSLDLISIIIYSTISLVWWFLLGSILRISRSLPNRLLIVILPIFETLSAFSSDFYLNSFLMLLLKKYSFFLYSCDFIWLFDLWFFMRFEFDMRCTVEIRYFAPISTFVITL